MLEDKKTSIGDYSKIMADRELFNKTVYTPLSEALRLLDERQKNPNLIKKIEELLNNDIPEPFKKKEKYGISGKQVATPNHDAHWFIELTNNYNLKPIFYEYLDDKFTPNNGFKHSLGQIHLHEDRSDRKGNNIEEKITIVDFNKYSGKKIKDVLTLWGEPLVDFHKRLFEICGYSKKDFIFYDGSDWLKRNGDIAENYYTKDLLLYICYGILFENFLLTGDEGKFTRDIFLPAFENIINITGVKPLIVPIPPMDNEDDSHWISYNKKIKPFIKLS
ncbi:MAG: hypothetical protein WC264_01010 [Candidatus Paceibacterota bacterium]|jgi:hypothetical protein